MDDYIYIYIYIYRIRRSTKRFVFFYLFILFFHTCYICVCLQIVAFVRKHMWHKALLMGLSMRLELTLVSSLNDLWLFRRVLYRGYSPFFQECVYFRQRYPSLIFDMFIALCVCAQALVLWTDNGPMCSEEKVNKHTGITAVVSRKKKKRISRNLKQTGDMFWPVVLCSFSFYVKIK